MNEIIRGIDVSKEYNMGKVIVKALSKVSFSIYEGEFIVILGPSGSGKSTLLNLIGGMDSLTYGELYYREKKIHDMDSKKLTMYRRNNIGFVFQFYNLMPNLNAYENIELSAQIAKKPLSIEEVLKEVGLYERKDHFPSQLSGGEQQRVALARALVKNPDILLCDEPTGALDTKTSLQVLKYLRKFCDDYKKTVVIITHNPKFRVISDRTFYLKDGQIEWIEIIENPVEVEKVEL